jgi:hypothetical protein
MAIETRQGFLDAIEPPARKPSLVGGQHEKQVQAEVLGPESWKDAFAAEAMVDPGERWRDAPHSLRHQQRQGLFQGHDVISVMGNSQCEGLATPPASSATMPDRSQIAEKKSLPVNGADFKSRWNWNNARRRTRAARAKKNLRRKSNPQKNKTTVMRACFGK